MLSQIFIKRDLLPPLTSFCDIIHSKIMMIWFNIVSYDIIISTGPNWMLVYCLVIKDWSYSLNFIISNIISLILWQSMLTPHHFETLLYCNDQFVYMVIRWRFLTPLLKTFKWNLRMNVAIINEIWRRIHFLIHFNGAILII